MRTEIRSWLANDDAMKKPPYVQTIRKPDGREYNYFRRRGYPRLELPAFADPTFERAYAQALQAERPPPGAETRPVAVGSFDDLTMRYYASQAYLGLSTRSRKDYRHHIEKMREEFGDLAVKRMSRHSCSSIATGSPLRMA